MEDEFTNNFHDNQESETLSLIDFTDPQYHRNPSSSSSSSADDVFDFFRRGLVDHPEENTMCHAEDIIICGKLVPINQQLHRQKPPQQTGNQYRINQQTHPHGCRRSRSESRSDVKSTTTVSPLVTNSRSLNCKQSCSSRWHAVLYGLVNVRQPEMDIRDLKNRRFRRDVSKMTVDSPVDVIPFSRSADRRKRSWRLLELLSCKSYATVAVTAPLCYTAKL
ncbi:hypothetical protein E3N88_28497 [Mikania micrantha]|uniref:Uncharacterized protein n=1 Tax=Mikania micrantha TaxID=192012 RepID=A0A5N6N0M9_9ASTR|nr:hypothetical protein E3N88_28497 [Mikania micrantha]